jgi:hypothetical protein
VQAYGGLSNGLARRHPLRPPFPGDSVFAVRPSRAAIPAKETPRPGEIAQGLRRGAAASLAPGIWAGEKP